MFRKTFKLLVCAIAMLIPLIAGVVVVMAKPAQQTTYFYHFAGKVEAQNKRALPELDVQISCAGLVPTTVRG